MMGYVKTLAVAALAGAGIGAVASNKIGAMVRGDEKRKRANRTQVKILEVPIDADDPDDLDVMVIKRKRK